MDDRKKLSPDESFNFKFPDGRIKKLELLVKSGQLSNFKISIPHHNPITL